MPDPVIVNLAELEPLEQLMCCVDRLLSTLRTSHPAFNSLLDLRGELEERLQPSREFRVVR